MASFARTLAGLHVGYGVVAILGSGFMLLRLIVDADSVGGCCGASFLPAFLMLFGVVFLLALPQVFAARSFLAGHARGAFWMALLSGANLAINLATVGCVLAGGGGAFAFCWLPFLLVNAAALIVFARLNSSRTSSGAASPGRSTGSHP